MKLPLAAALVPLLLLLLLLPAAALAHAALDGPNGGEQFQAGETVTITWHSYVLHIFENYDLWYALDAPDPLTMCQDQAGPTWIPLAMDLPASCPTAGGNCDAAGDCVESYEWTIPEGISSDQVKIRIRQENVDADYHDVSNLPFTITVATAVAEPAAPELARLLGAFPNPFNPRTEIRFTLAKRERVRVTVHDVAGNRVALLIDESRGAGAQSVIWNGVDERNEALPSGIYLVRIVSPSARLAGKLTLLQ
jgi:hypothetical protein